MNHATGALGSLLPKLVQLLANEYSRLKGVRKDVEFLERELRSIHAALRKVAEVPREQLDEQVWLWASEVRELSYSIEDVVDRFMVRVEDSHKLKRVKKKMRVEGSEPVADSSHELKRLIKKMADLFTMGRTRHQIAHAIKDIKEKIVDVAARRDRYRIDNVVADSTAATVDPRLLALYKDQKELVGIKEASLELTNMLAGGNDDPSMQHPKILSIFGFGGLGKTTVAKVVYDGIKDQFECVAFVSVGRNPNLKKLVKSILFELDKQKYMRFNEARFNERQLIDELRGLLQNKRSIHTPVHHIIQFHIF
jgi:disease resistance protein RPM1